MPQTAALTFPPNIWREIFREKNIWREILPEKNIWREIYYNYLLINFNFCALVKNFVLFKKSKHFVVHLYFDINKISWSTLDKKKNFIFFYIQIILKSFKQTNLLLICVIIWVAISAKLHLVCEDLWFF